MFFPSPRIPGTFSAQAADEALRSAVADTCYRVLCHAGVYKQDAAGQAGLMRFLGQVFPG